ncbi:Ldh family oxidoreductase [Raineya orbicola]|uniref:Malate/L-lactate dehydrogenase n=1 Tax=Raineya orbicola TaxID=2016530 RepID=A0A2N3IJJ0_9BACT|nr:Ldh family oxidoreductase [Raineya orbicola]PKQ70502.1 Malate/L-lactate dehydrogenase [Raineya orbicola]
MHIFSYEILFNFIQAVFIKIGFSEKEALLATEALLKADLRGIDSHGIARLSGYVRLWEAKRLNPQPQMKIIYETPTTATLDGDSGVGLVVAQKAMEIAMQKAETYGTGWVAVQNSNHFGIAGYHAMLALQKNMIGIALTNASPLVAPTFSVDRLLGTNPIAVAIPAQTEPPFVADFATTTAANGKLEILERKGENAPWGWLQDAEGNITTDTQARKKGGALLPLGSDYEHGSHKGYCLGALVDIFSGVFSGANYASWVPPFVSYLSLPTNPVGKGIGHFLGAIRIDAFRPKEEFLSHMDNWIRAFRNAKAVKDKKVLIPGDIERETEKERLQSGIPLMPSVVADLNNLAEKFQIDPLAN